MARRVQEKQLLLSEVTSWGKWAQRQSLEYLHCNRVFRYVNKLTLDDDDDDADDDDDDDDDV
jgi:hypothetical protein